MKHDNRDRIEGRMDVMRCLAIILALVIGVTGDKWIGVVLVLTLLAHSYLFWTWNREHERIIRERQDAEQEERDREFFAKVRE